jgi:hypothetical protein
MSQTRRLAAILAADVAGYSRLMGADEEGTLESLKAVRCALEVQQAMPARASGVAADSRIELRIGLNLGNVIVEGDDLYGDRVNIVYSPPIESVRTRIRESSSTAMHPRSNAVAKVGRLASSSAACCSGFLPRSCLWMTTDGSRSRLNARRVPKSVSAETMILPSFFARSKISSSATACRP